MYLFSALSVVLYVNLDCLDGKQARRTRSSSPLGQLFDHGCDALSVGLLMDGVHTAVNYPCNWIASLTLMSVRAPLAIKGLCNARMPDVGRQAVLVFS